MSEHWNIYFYRKKTQNPIEDYLNSLSLEELAQAEKEIKLLARHGPFLLGRPHVRYLENKLWELRIRGKNQHRILWFMFGEKNIFFLHAFSKKQNRIERRHFEIAYQRMKNVIFHFGGDSE